MTRKRIFSKKCILPFCVAIVCICLYICFSFIKFGITSSLFVNCEKGRADKVAAILKIYPSLVNTQYISEQTPLHSAASFGQIKVVAILLKNGANVNAADSYGITPLIEAICSGKIEIVRMLIASGANLNMFDKNGDTAIHYTIMNDPDVPSDLGILKLLVESGADVNECKRGERTPLSFALSNAQRNKQMWADNKTLLIDKRIIAYLKQHGAKS